MYPIMSADALTRSDLEADALDKCNVEKDALKKAEGAGENSPRSPVLQVAHGVAQCHVECNCHRSTLS